MQRIEIGRYPVPAEGWAGYVEGTRDDGSTWVMFLDESGSPAQFYGRREPDGAVVGDPVVLTPA
ncbi:hypothetical protein [Mycolicibacterium conceptionense]|uniref:hypothetical protein n=1 Tax=Mycolicibacterium conceptionense TaxID=451644 RepID=UPI0010552FE3|nr:hypothetical protein [Mycolicibacterium conceptionense]